ncbi:MAG: glycosyltransferase [Phycisphaerales bacterium]|nr:glycosyltransferase [Phycisphaerales bacterium]
MTSDALVYLASALPALSETFVYNELFALRARGGRVLAASVHRPAAGLGDPRLEVLAAESIPVYGAGVWRLLRDAAVEGACQGPRALGTLGLALRDLVCARDVRGVRRLKILWQALAALALARRLRARGVRHLHAHMAHVPTTLAMYAARQLGVTFSFTGHANDLFPQRALLAEKLRRAAFTACISHWHRAFYREVVTALPDERLPLVRCGVEVPSSAATPGRRPRLEVLAVGRLVPKKGFDVLLRAIAQLVAAGCDLTCRIVGGGPEDGALRRLADALALRDRVSFDGPQPHMAVQAAVRAADLFVLPCRIDSAGDRDGIPVVLMEALAAGVPVVAGDLPAIRELIRHEDTGLLTVPGDVAAVATALRRLYDDRDLLRALATRGRAWVAEEFERDVNITRLCTAFAQHTAVQNVCQVSTGLRHGDEGSGRYPTT